MRSIFSKNNIFIRMRSISPALRWALVGFCFSMLGNQAYEGSVLPSIIIVGLPAWVIGFRKTFMTVADFLSPCSGWIVDKLGGFRALAMTEGVEGVLSLLPLLMFGSPAWKWSLVALSCALLITGQVIDIASEVFEVDAAGGDDSMIVNYSGIVSILASVTGTLLGSPLGSWIASWSIPAVLIFSSVTSFAACATRFIMKQDIAQASCEVEEASQDVENESSESQENRESQESQENQANDVSKKSTSKQSTNPLLKSKIMLLLGSLLVAFIPACSVSYILLGIGKQYSSQSLTILYIFTGVGSVLASVLYAHSSQKLGLRKVAILGIAVSLLAYCFMFINLLPMMCFAFFLQAIGGMLLVEPIIVARQILFKGSTLAKFSGWARLAFAIGATSGSWIGFVFSSTLQWQLLPILALIFTAGLLFVLPQLPNTRYAD
ncbi:MFS transporter [Bifidobacteriaceae bacterium NR044]|nr:MFS transporter [Bifidobacteriaceae bacterium NR043]MBF9353797.1 MFS transporter [Bifidobacteriaceae bacterium NR044]RFT39866.1 MFS transporter [Bifidobacteriaceae bacterium NR003]